MFFYFFSLPFFWKIFFLFFTLDLFIPFFWFIFYSFVIFFLYTFCFWKFILHRLRKWCFIVAIATLFYFSTTLKISLRFYIFLLIHSDRPSFSPPLFLILPSVFCFCNKQSPLPPNCNIIQLAITNSSVGCSKCFLKWYYFGRGVYDTTTWFCSSYFSISCILSS
jgi:hypothetical protein